MFEKEAEEYARLNNPAEYGVRATHFTVLNSFKDGAEFGYNKAKEEDKALIEKMKSIHNCKYGAYMVGCTLDNKGCRAKDGCEKWEIKENG